MRALKINGVQTITITSVRRLIPEEVWKDQGVCWTCQSTTNKCQEHSVKPTPRVIRRYVRGRGKDKGCPSCRGGGSLPGGPKYRRALASRQTTHQNLHDGESPKPVRALGQRHIRRLRVRR